jgi:hypothetical protein
VKGDEEVAQLERRNTFAELQETFDVKVFPNPNTGADVQLTITGIYQENVMVKITNTLGQTVYSNRFFIESGQFYTPLQFNSTLTSGLYFLEVSTDADLH